MLNIIGTFIIFITVLLLTTVSLAGTCAPDDAACVLSQKKLEVFKDAGVKPVETKDQPVEEKDKKPSKPQPFQIPQPGSNQLDAGQDTSDQPAPVRFNPGLKLPVLVNQDDQEQAVVPQPQQPLGKPMQPTNIYR